MTRCRGPGVLLLMVSFVVLKDGAERAGRRWEVEGKEMVTYHLMPQGMPDNETHLELAALDQVIVRLFQEGRVDPRAFAGVVFPESAPPVSEFSSSTVGVFPEGSSVQQSHYTAALNFTSLISRPQVSSSPISTFPSSVLPPANSPTSSPFRPTSRPPTLPTPQASNFLAAAKMDSFTLCLWFLLTYIGEFAVVLSYRTHMKGPDTLTLGPQRHFFFMEYTNITGWELEGHVEPQRWHSACIVRNGTARRVSLFLDSVRRIDMEAPEQIYLNGTLVLGNYQDYVGGGFTTAQSAPGLVTGVYLWARMLSLSEVRDVGNCVTPDEALLAWEVTTWRMVGDVVREHANPCHQDNSHTRFLLPIRINPLKAQWFCAGHGLALPFPTSKEENDEVRAYISVNLTSCGTNYIRGTSTWMDIVYDLAKERWLGGPYRQPINFSSIRYVNSKTQVYLRMDVSSEWLSGAEEDVSCTMCQGNDTHLHVYIHGLCQKEELTEHYGTLYPRSDKRGIYYLQGLTGLRLYHESGHRWVLRHVPTNTLIAQDNSAEFFWGRKVWQLSGTAVVCGPQRQLSGPHNLTISWCRPGSFTCTSGECVPLTARCSLHPECEDESDEMGCQLVHAPDDYQTYLAPYTPFLPLNFTIVLNKLWSVDLKGQLVHVTFQIHLRWRDRRLAFRNLQDNPSLNVISVAHSRFRAPFGPIQGPVWHPQVQVQDNKRLAGEVNPRLKLFVRKMSPGVDVLTDLVYEGVENDLEYSLEFESNVHCELNLTMYPFDSQQCSITATVVNVINKAVQYPPLPSGHAHPTLPTHPEFTITVLTLNLVNQSTTACLTFTLHRRPAHQLFSTFLPIVLLHLIGYSSFFLPLDNFQERSLMSLTTLLALVALYSESLAALPSTSYLKHIDIWFVFSIAFLTAIVITHLGINDDKRPVMFLPKDPSYPSPALWQRLRMEFQSRSTDWKLMVGAKVGLGVTYVLFQCIYWGRVFFAFW